MKLRHRGIFTRYLVRILKREKVKNIQFGKDWVSFEYDGEKIKNKIIIKKHESYVGSWAKTKDKIYIDDDIKGKIDVKAVALHESIEKFASQKYGLRYDVEAHDLADAKEKEFLERVDGTWIGHQRKVDKVWRKEGKK
ncbi:MAG: hypothetical protein NTW30_03445 [Candidatus Aenigmarchaeota archaeon]|nr:hypothetical protein [Candidatus Aenigmarchaeota archaeon]